MRFCFVVRFLERNLGTASVAHNPVDIVRGFRRCAGSHFLYHVFLNFLFFFQALAAQDGLTALIFMQFPSGRRDAPDCTQ